MLSEVHVHDFSLFLIDLKPSVPSILCEMLSIELLLWIKVQYHLHSRGLVVTGKGPLYPTVMKNSYSFLYLLGFILFLVGQFDYETVY